ncbi:MAG TPA: hypothetical protein VNS88_17530 [Nitrospiraceae bacterium]|nr:hypothetical protein [Nitrospiraceae bacterium]
MPDNLDKQIHSLGVGLQSANSVIMELIRQKDRVYGERDMVIAALTKLFPSHLTRHKDTPGENWDAEWLNVVCIHLPTGQATWHIHISELAWFQHLNGIELKCEGYTDYTTPEKYQRLFRLPMKWQTGLYLSEDLG